jgi:uncharacterized surface protein with fasciclin (FAS1) repeats
MKIISKFTLILLAAVTFSACNDDTETPTPMTTTTEMNIVESAIAKSNLSSLVAALKAADGNLVDVLNGPGPFTVLAPTNEAFASFLSKNGFANLEAVPTDVLSQILLNHVISGEVKASDLTSSGAGYATTNATGPNGTKLSIYFNTTGGVMFNGMSTVSEADLMASNGIIHVVDAVIGLPTIVDFAIANPALSNLVAALQFADSSNMPSPNLVNTLSGTDLYTVFAPTDNAFASLLMELDSSGETTLFDLSGSLVTTVLTNHVVSGNVRSSNLSSGTVTTLGGSVELDATKFMITDQNMRNINIITSLVDIQAINGVVHAIDKVILPKQ